MVYVRRLASGIEVDHLAQNRVLNDDVGGTAGRRRNLRFGSHPSLRVAIDLANGFAMDVISVGEQAVVLRGNVGGERRVANTLGNRSRIGRQRVRRLGTLRGG